MAGKNARTSAKVRRKKGETSPRPIASKSPQAGERFVIREVVPDDIDALYGLSKFLNSVNFPHDQEVLGHLIQTSGQSFRGTIKDPFRREYLFVLEGIETKRVMGTSAVFAQHGHPDAPHIFFDVVEDQRYSITLGRHFNHTTLRLGFDYRGPTEIGALVVAPEYRSFGLGKPLSYVRFLFMATYRERFRPDVIAELMPPLLPDGRSLLWEHLGKHYTGLTYQAADKLSHSNKEFIIALFPQTPIHVSLLPADVASLIGQVGEETKGVKRMLEEVGFEYSHRIDPFDGGPHFEAQTDRITVIKDTRLVRVSRSNLSSDEERSLFSRESPPNIVRMLVGIGKGKGPTQFRATVGAARFDGNDLALSEETLSILQIRPGAVVQGMPF